MAVLHIPSQMEAALLNGNFTLNTLICKLHMSGKKSWKFKFIF